MVESQQVGPKGPCADCGSSDGLGTYDDGHTHCFSCGVTTQGAVNSAENLTLEKVPGDLISLGHMEMVPPPGRKLFPETVKLFDYGTTADGREVATYYDADRRPVGQKVRGPNKKFSVLGDLKTALPYGAQLWPRSGKMLVVTEGEIDAMSMSQVQGNKYPVVSIACGAGPQVKKYFAAHREYFRAFETIVLMFDNDSVGNAAAVASAETLALPYGRVKIAALPLKDANDMLKAGRADDLYNAMWRAVAYRPTGFVDIGDIAGDIMKGPTLGDPWPWEGLTKATFGRRPGEIFTLGAGTGIGKTSTWLQVGAEICRSGEKVGFILFENSQKDAGLRIASALAGRPFFVPDGSWTSAQLEEALTKLSGKCLLYDTANADWSSCEAMIRYWAGAEDCKHIVLDHLSAFSAQEEDDRKALDSVMASLAALTQELGLCVYLISHLKRPMGQSHEEGGRVRLDQLRGSNAIAMWSNFVFGLERDQQANDKHSQLTCTLRVLKDRNTGRATGDTFSMRYRPELARLVEENSFSASFTPIVPSVATIPATAATAKEAF